MGKELSMYMECKIKDGQTDALRETLDALGADVREHEPDTLDYRSFVDGDRVIFMDTYADAAAFLDHFGRESVQKALGAIAQQVEFGSFNLLGDASDEVQTALADFKPNHLKPFSGFRRA